MAGLPSLDDVRTLLLRHDRIIQLLLALAVAEQLWAEGRYLGTQHIHDPTGRAKIWSAHWRHEAKTLLAPDTGVLFGQHRQQLYANVENLAILRFKFLRGNSFYPVMPELGTPRRGTGSRLVRWSWGY